MHSNKFVVGRVTVPASIGVDTVIDPTVFLSRTAGGSICLDAGSSLPARRSFTRSVGHDGLRPSYGADSLFANMVGSLPSTKGFSQYVGEN